MTVKQTVVAFLIPKADVKELDECFFFKFGEEEVSEPKNKVAVLDVMNTPDESQPYVMVFVWKWIFEKVMVLKRCAKVVGEFYVEKVFTEKELFTTWKASQNKANENKNTGKLTF